MAWTGILDNTDKTGVIHNNAYAVIVFAAEDWASESAQVTVYVYNSEKEWTSRKQPVAQFQYQWIRGGMAEVANENGNITQIAIPAFEDYFSEAKLTDIEYNPLVAVTQYILSQKEWVGWNLLP